MGCMVTVMVTVLCHGDSSSKNRDYNRHHNRHHKNGDARVLVVLTRSGYSGPLPVASGLSDFRLTTSASPGINRLVPVLTAAGRP
jgi:hypothetical protein